jgi:hypothetical protein
VAPDATVKPFSPVTFLQKRAASLFAAVDSGFEGEPEFTVDHSASGPDAVDFMDVANGRSLAVEGRSEAVVDYAGHAQRVRTIILHGTETEGGFSRLHQSGSP